MICCGDYHRIVSPCTSERTLTNTSCPLLEVWELQEVLNPFHSEYCIIKALRFRNWALCLSRTWATAEVLPLELRCPIKVMWPIPGNAEMIFCAGHLSLSSRPVISAAKIRVNEVPDKWWILHFLASSS